MIIFKTIKSLSLGVGVNFSLYELKKTKVDSKVKGSEGQGH